MYKTINSNVTAELIEKKSKFIANMYYIQNVEQAEEIIKKLKRKFYDARHNCFAYIVCTKDGMIKKASDDGEPSGTAGAPMLNVLEKNELCNVLVVVTRYFGGILLGTGGLVRAYTEATIRAVKIAEFAKEENGCEVLVEIKYSDLENFKYYCKSKNIKIIDMQYNNNIECFIEVNEEEKNNIIIDKQIDFVKYKIICDKNIRK